MEDQQPATGDLTSASAVDTAAAETEAAPVESATEELVDAENIDDAGEDADESTEDDAGIVRFRERRPATKWTTIAAAVAAVLFVGAGAFAGAMMQPYLADRAAVATKLNVARTAANAITTLWTYNPDNIDKLADRASQYLSGDFQAAYRKYLDALVAPNKQAKVTNTTQVVGAAVESLAGSDATAIVYTNTASTSPTTKDVPSLKYLSYRLVLQRDHQRWLVTKMTTITSLDLTPKF
ncbi:mammalian cell entry protein [Candidatus Mycobacterium wuenschmannii]|uniref:Mammalian cell entry protein n=1 Tax=Candidatus Mycobacterium wuenschmannii TaxID=3027808 RepID=A0ABY8VW23_9MYCO|nr:mammalian cell entry protein [Candidatus Mycobacterium wuenschmannii]WIM86984.1 mammalian cell entry protein [Candidatus Mycobacterium wuenschmannii]